jgi:hypothetical protein
MGAIRKTMSIATLGAVGWTSKKERLRQTEAELAAAREDLDRTTRKEELLKEKLLHAERRVEAAELEGLRDARRARRRGARQAKKAARKDHAHGLAQILDTAVEDTRRRSKDVRAIAEARAAELGARTARTRRRARKRAEKATKRAVKRGDATREQLVHAAEEATASVRAKARELTSR